VTENFQIENPRLDPIVALAMNGGRLEYRVSDIVDYRERTVVVVRDWLFTKIAEEISKSDGRLKWASGSTSSAKQSSMA
jgi:hypothetical protein